jgi:hypothetical protein
MCMICMAVWMVIASFCGYLIAGPFGLLIGVLVVGFFGVAAK